MLGLQQSFERKKPENKAAFVKEYVEQYQLGVLEGIVRRIMMDLQKPPPPEDQAPPARPQEPPAAPKSGKAGGKPARRRAARKP